MDLKISLLNFNFVIIYMIHQMLVLLKNQLHFLKDNIFEYVFKKCSRLLIKKKIIFFTTYNDRKENSEPEEQNISKDIRYLFK